VSSRVDVIKSEVEQIYIDDNLTELIDKQMKELRKLHRKRFQDSGDFNDYPFFGYEEEMMWDEEY
jgi:hypothetical protein